MRLRKLGHSCLLVEESDSRILFDPGCFSEGLEGLEGLSGILVTHNHEDHLDPARLRMVLDANPDARVICDKASADVLHECGVTATTAHSGDSFDVGMAVGVYGREHAVIHPDLPNLPNVGYLLADRFFFAGDALTVPDSPVEILAVPVSAAWMKVSEVVDWLRTVHPRTAIPVHDYGNPFAEWIYDLYEQLTPSDTAITVVTDEDFTRL
ncbi:MBL fold metallo-hydrolase [Flindersiella endophytica]